MGSEETLGVIIKAITTSTEAVKGKKVRGS